MAQVVEHLPSKHKVLSSNSSSTEGKRKKTATNCEFYSYKEMNFANDLRELTGNLPWLGLLMRTQLSIGLIAA
jgi:hypothetical protein